MGHNKPATDFVVDLVIEFEGEGVDPASIASRIDLPGTEFARGAGDHSVALTTIVAAEEQAAAATRVHDAVLAQLSDVADLITRRTVSTASLGDLYGWIEPGFPDDDSPEPDLLQLIEHHVWNRGAWDYEEFLMHARGGPGEPGGKLPASAAGRRSVGA
ncbi:MAG: hypothetical protein WCF04_02025 [Candidatus Nanopelagicales bacterium]